MRATSEAFIKAWETWSIEPVMAMRAPDCKQTMYPKNVGFAARTNEEFRTYFKSLDGVFSNARMTIDDYLAVNTEKKAVVRSTMRADAPWGLFENEYVWYLTFTEDGRLITEIVEFIDSLSTQEVRAKLQKYREKTGESH
ncbi:hypothetical protein LTR78_003835 [Recurvomyces mirabilis]|uniref:SnoaL-like domain-containing protein n=1 Tax=Recurvomyces mirabilis TaxID=574656 RepID=A0AAE0WQF0_9PEZI|nr:hypothetical protein LTR78_003835 [Recurvomyces mirabilis]KAK5154026.1 hypothetical protein LTS14_007246 [Recurvomyces mirabilis]